MNNTLSHKSSSTEKYRLKHTPTREDTILSQMTLHCKQDALANSCIFVRDRGCSEVWYGRIDGVSYVALCSVIVRFSCVSEKLAQIMAS